MSFSCRVDYILVHPDLLSVTAFKMGVRHTPHGVSSVQLTVLPLVGQGPGALHQVALVWIGAQELATISKFASACMQPGQHASAHYTHAPG